MKAKLITIILMITLGICTENVYGIECAGSSILNGGAGIYIGTRRIIPGFGWEGIQCQSDTGLCWWIAADPHMFEPINNAEGCILSETEKENWCNNLSNKHKALWGCPMPEPTPEEKCESFKNLFDPPAENCIFQIENGDGCHDGDYNLISYYYRVRASDGRISDWQWHDPSAENAGVECQSIINGCLNPDGEGCWQNVDTGACVYRDSDGNLKMKPECWSDNSTPPEGGWGDLCDMGLVECPPPGGGDTGGGDTGGGDTGGGGTGGGDTGSGGTGGGGTGGGGTGGGGTGGGDTGGGNTGGGGNTPGGTGGDGGGTGGGSSGTGSSDTGDDDDLGGHSGDGDWGSIDGKEGMDKGKDDLEDELNKIFEKIENSGVMQAIKGHRYITMISPVCYASIPLPMYNQTIQMSLCEYESQLRLLGNVLFGMITIGGFLMLLRS